MFLVATELRSQKGVGEKLRDKRRRGCSLVLRGCVHHPGDMESWLVLAFCILSVAALGKVRERCELAAAVKHLGPNNFQGRSLGLCKSRGHMGWEFPFNKLLSRYLCSEKLHGSMLGHRSKGNLSLFSVSESWILQTNSCWWCSGGRTPRAKHMCNIPCSGELSFYRWCCDGLPSHIPVANRLAQVGYTSIFKIQSRTTFKPTLPPFRREICRAVLCTWEEKASLQQEPRSPFCPS
ncbi:lysozyme C [Falco peregrinus]|uniref:lysozyme C n=1 Tax=Falco peregrinus TaxID=8954 RepID=UPI0024789821|nr:lysozyme C [Falco peregrinus]